MRGWFFLVALLLSALSAADAPAQQAEQRIALIIANEAYVSPNLGRLPGTQRDAAAMETALRTAGFTVAVRRNLDRAQMRDAISTFTRALRAAGQNGVGFLYFSGHGIADGPRGQNYLIPVDAGIADVTDLPLHGLALNEALDAIELAGARASIVVIDACRNTPVALGRGSRGLVPVEERTNTLVAFSTQANATAADDGIYARALSRELVQPGADAVNVFARVTQVVATETARRQVPRYDNGLIEPIVFVGAAPPPIDVAATSSAPPQVAVSTINPPEMGPEVFLGQWRRTDGRARGAAITQMCTRYLEIVSVSTDGVVYKTYDNEPSARTRSDSVTELAPGLIRGRGGPGMLPLGVSYVIAGDRLMYTTQGTTCDYERVR